MKTKSFLLLVSILMNSSIIASEGDRVRNGGGLAEQNFIYSLQVLPRYIDICINDNDCLISDYDRDVLTQIKEIAKQTRIPEKKFIFLSEKDRPGFFHNENDPEVRLAITEDKPSSPIYVNLDLLYRRDLETGVLSIMKIPVIVGNLIHELGHQIKIYDHSYLDTLGSKVRRQLTKNRAVYKFPADLLALNITINNLTTPSLPLIYMTYNDKITRLEGHLYNNLKCDDDNFAIGAFIENGRWDRPSDSSAMFDAWVTLFCNGESEIKSEIKSMKLLLDVESGKLLKFSVL
jgi:hypothetical protein